MLTPFQRLLQCTIHGSSPRSILLAASGPSLRVFDSSTGQYLSKWSPLDTEVLSREGSPGSQDEEITESPAKKRKLDNGNTSETPSAEILIENGSGRRKPSRRGFPIPSIAHLLGAADGKHLVVVTGEDKSVRVLSISENGTLRQYSQRVLPKRPSALALTPDQKTILCADKFGDVYSLPLLGEPFKATPVADAKSETVAEEEMFKPSASLTTVHTKRNLRALESQQKQKKVKKKPKDELQFEHELLLGHVSLLTDIACVKIKTEQGADRTYILTADRDEHIRVSRGIPQAHIIENFCLGHEQFVSKMHIPPWQPETLISGGGDEYLFIWKWQRGLIKQKINLKDYILEKKSSVANGTSTQIAVSGIWSMQTRTGGQIVVTCEASCSLLFFSISTNGDLELEPIFQATLPHNVLDVAVLPQEMSIVVSMDNVHQPGTTHEAVATVSSHFLARFKFDTTSEHGIWSQVDDEITTQINEFAKDTSDPATEHLNAPSLGDSFYHIEHFRKRAGYGPEAEEELELPEDAP